MEGVPLDESVGEGYHRDTHNVLLRASAAKSAYVKQSTRTKPNIKLMKRWLNMGDRGREVLRYEWRTWKRVLQVRRRFLWRSKRMSPEKVFDRIYRTDE